MNKKTLDELEQLQHWAQLTKEQHHELFRLARIGLGLTGHPCVSSDGHQWVCDYCGEKAQQERQMTEKGGKENP